MHRLPIAMREIGRRCSKSHETVCLANASDREAHAEITVVFAQREPAGPHRVTAGGRRRRHAPFKDPWEPEPFSAETEYARGSTRGSPRTVTTTAAYSEGGVSAEKEPEPWPTRQPMS